MNTSYGIKVVRERFQQIAAIFSKCPGFIVYILLWPVQLVLANLKDSATISKAKYGLGAFQQSPINVGV